MRPAPGPIPDVMPTYEGAIRKIVFLMDIPRERLMNYSISELVNTYSDGTPKWLVGSTVWLPAVFGQVDKETDLDIVFQKEDAARRFVNGTLEALNSRKEGFTAGANGNNGLRVIHPDRTHIMDIWWMEPDETIEEMLMSFPHPYQRCGYYMTWSGSSPAYLRRIVKERVRMRRAENPLATLFDNLGRARQATPYGRPAPAPTPAPMPVPAPLPPPVVVAPARTEPVTPLHQRWDGGYGR